jgi:hypothetical protein
MTAITAVLLFRPDGHVNERKHAEQLETAIRHQDGLRVLRDRPTPTGRASSTFTPASWLPQSSPSANRHREEQEEHLAAAAASADAASKAELTLSWLQSGQGQVGSAADVEADDDEPEAA